MFPKLLAMFIGIPLVEMIILIKLGEQLGFFPTLGLVVVTGILGASLARYQGFRTFTRIQSELSAGRMPTSDLIDGLLILIGGIVLLTPGLLTDLFGFSLLMPPVRTFIKSWLRKRFEGMISNGKTEVFYRPLDPTDSIEG